MEKADKIRQLVDSHTALLEAVAGLCVDDFEARFGIECLSPKARLAHIAAENWEMAKLVRDVAQAQWQMDSHQLAGPDRAERMAGLVGQRCSCTPSEAVSEVVLSLQALIDELQPLPDEHFFRGFNPGRPESEHSLALLVDATLRSAQAHCEEIWSWRGR
ncbi:MAG: hypothetical protein HYY30_02400 [Chloroflexi bacterium]|nr:hypothetical protein [Chloroflexota bacterium]